VFDLYAITPERSPAAIERGVAQLLSTPQAGRIAVLLRAKHLALDERRALGRALRARTAERGAALLVSGEIELCAELAADGVQLPEHGPSVAHARAVLGATRLIGASRHDAAGLATAAVDGASFATLSPVFASPGKGEPLGTAAFATLARQAALPIVALGGIESQHVAGLVLAGAAAIAVIRAVFEHSDPGAAASTFLAAIDRARAARDSET
jgi:thiamine-phosphate pyrophosphorylase